MSEERRYPVDILQQALARHARDAAGSGNGDWLAKVLELLRSEIDIVPPPEQAAAETVPEYIYPH